MFNFNFTIIEGDAAGETGVMTGVDAATGVEGPRGLIDRRGVVGALSTVRRLEVIILSVLMESADDLLCSTVGGIILKFQSWRCCCERVRCLI